MDFPNLKRRRRERDEEKEEDKRKIMEESKRDFEEVVDVCFELSAVQKWRKGEEEGRGGR